MWPSPLRHRNMGENLTQSCNGQTITKLCALSINEPMSVAYETCCLDLLRSKQQQKCLVQVVSQENPSYHKQGNHSQPSWHPNSNRFITFKAKKLYIASHVSFRIGGHQPEQNHNRGKSTAFLSVQECKCVIRNSC